MRHKHDDSFDAEAEHLEIEDEAREEPRERFGTLGFPTEVVKESAAEHDLHVEKDHDGAEGDDGLISGDDPNFEHLVKPKR